MEQFVGGVWMEVTTVELLLFADYLKLMAEKDEDAECLMLDEV